MRIINKYSVYCEQLFANLMQNLIFVISSNE